MHLGLLLSLALLASARAGDNFPKLGDCAPRSCGTAPNISFPFWISGVHESYCGQELFKVNCSGTSPWIDISGESYDIHNISYTDRTISLSRTNATSTKTSGRNCSLLPAQTLHLVDPFFHPADGWLYFYSNCTESLKEPLTGMGKISCQMGNITEPYYIVKKNEGLNMNCSAPVKYPATTGWELNYTEYGNFLNRKFKLRWSGLDCTKCSNSGGECGYNATTTAPICICPDRVHAISCKYGDSKPNRIERAMIVASLIFGGFLLACFVILCIRHVKRNSTSFLGTFLRRIFNDNTMGKELTPLENSFQTHIFSYKELEDATDCFAASNEIGDGGFGAVYKGKLRDGRAVAVKRLYECNYRRLDQFVNEVSIFNRIRHRNLVSFYGCTNYHSRGLLLVYEYIPNGTVADHLYGSRADQPLTLPMRMTIATETAEALAYLHAVEPPIIHRDIKTSNILLDDHYHVKVADFGLSRLFPPDTSYVSTAPQGTPGYLDPEYHRQYRLTDKSDVYSFGVVLAELISSKPAVDLSRNISEINLADMAINKIQSSLLHELVDHALGFETDQDVRRMVEEVAMLAFRCLQTVKESRPSMLEVFHVLEEIINKNHATVKSGKDASEESHLLCSAKSSPNSVHVAWVSRPTTPNTSD